MTVIVAASQALVLASRGYPDHAGLDIAALVVAVAIITLIGVMWIRRRRWRRALGLTHPGREAWSGKNAPSYEKLSYQRRDDSGQGGGGMA